MIILLHEVFGHERLFETENTLASYSGSKLRLDCFAALAKTVNYDHHAKPDHRHSEAQRAADIQVSVAGTAQRPPGIRQDGGNGYVWLDCFGIYASQRRQQTIANHNFNHRHNETRLVAAIQVLFGNPVATVAKVLYKST